MKARYSYRAYPKKAQVEPLARLFGCVRVAYNDAVYAMRAAREAGGKTPSAKRLSEMLTESKRTDERHWMAEVSAVPLQQSVRDAAGAMKKFFDSVTGVSNARGVRPPKFKKRSNRQSARFTKNARFKVVDRGHGAATVCLPGVGDVPFKLSRPLPAEPSSVTIIKDSDGSYWLSFVVEVEPDVSEPAHPGRAAALDVGLTDFAAIVYDDGSREKIENPRHMRKAAKRLKRAQRAMSRKKKGSNNRERARVRVAREHRRVRQARLDFHHQLSTRLIRENQAISVEKLSVAGLSRSGAKGKKGRATRRAWADAGMGQFLTMLAAKAAIHDRVFAAVDPFWTSQTCSVCGVHDGPKPLNIRVWDCAACGAHLDRDWNAAVNVMLAAGQVERVNARGGALRLQLAEARPGEARTASAHALAA